MDLGQLGGVIRYELLMQLRRGTILLFGLFFLIGSLGLTTLLASGNMGTPTQEILRVRFEGENVTLTTRITATDEVVTETFPVDSDQGRWIPRWYGDVDYPQVMATWKAFAVLSSSLLLILIAVPPLLAEVIPLDKHYKVREVMDSTPLTRSAYLMGKLTATWISLVGVMAVCGVIFGLFAWNAYGAMDLWTYARFWLFIVLPMALIITGFAVIVPAVAPSRRVAILMGVGLLVVSIRMAMTFIPGSFLSNLFAPESGIGGDARYGDIVDSMFNGILTQSIPYALMLIAVAVMVWAWMRFRESYS